MFSYGKNSSPEKQERGSLLYNKLMNKQHILAKNLRKNSTIQERRIWNILKNRQFHNLKFKRQQPIGNYIVDFACQEKRLIIEIDGSQHNFPNNLEYDQKRTQYLEKLGYTDFGTMKFLRILKE